MRHVYDTRVEWMKALFFSNIAAVAWVTATGNVQPPGWAFSHTVILMCIFNCVGIFTALFVRVQFVKRQRALEAQVATSATGDQALEMLAKAFPQKAYGVSSIAIAFVLVVATGGWIWALSEHRSEQPSERHAGRRSEPSVETPAHPIATPPHQPSGSDSRPK
jgi:hypothetical protein